MSAPATKSRRPTPTWAWLSAAALVAWVVLLWLVVSMVRRDPSESLPIPPTPESAATGFAEAYAAGDTPRACDVTSGMALKKMQDRGWCETSGGWEPTTPTLIARCDISSINPNQMVFVYRTPQTLLSFPGLVVSTSGIDGKFLVVGFGEGSGEEYLSLSGALAAFCERI